MRTAATHLSCSRCQMRHELGVEQHTCTSCGAPLMVEYDLERVRGEVRPGDLVARPASMWRYRELLALRDDANLISLGEGLTPLVPVPTLGSRLGLRHLWIKDEGRNPTGTFKARGASSGTSMAKELGVGEVSLPSAGNAGTAWAAYGAAAGLAVHVTLPIDAPALCRAEVVAHGAELIVGGETLPEAAAMAARRAEAEGWYEAATWREPYRLDGKRTMGLEIAEQLGWSMPDAIVFPTGGGIGIVAIRRALAQLRELGWVRGDVPRLIAVQPEGCAPLVRAFEEGSDETAPWDRVETMAAGLRVPASLGHPLVLRDIRETGGTAVAVTDAEMIEAIAGAASATGILPSPEGAATIAALSRLRARDDLHPDDRVVVVSTSAGMRYPEAVAAARDVGRLSSPA